MIAQILDEIDTLKTVPHHNIVDPDKLNAPFEVRTLPVWPYVVYFEIVEADKVVRIIHIRHGARRPPARLG